MSLTRRAVLSGIVGTAGAAAFGVGRPSTGWSSIVVGAGVFGAWTAWNLLRKGERVLLLDAWGPAHARASSGGESRVTRTAYGADEVYTRMAWESLADWRWLSERSGLPVFHQTGVLFFFPRVEPYLTQSLEVHRRLKLPTQELQRAEMAKRWPQINWDGIEVGLYEPQFGALMARRAVQTLVAEFVKAGGEFRTAAVASPESTTEKSSADARSLTRAQRRTGDALLPAATPAPESKAALNGIRTLAGGGGSGHGFKHGPAVGRYAADLATGALKTIEPRFSLASKATVQRRSVH